RIVAEDTRRTRQLLTHLGIAGGALERLDAHARDHDVARVVEALVGGARVALVTDAGTPVVSDPGAELVARAADAGVEILAIPGPSAVVAALSVSGFAGSFRFVGFLPRAGVERRDALRDVVEARDVVILFESPERLRDTLADLAAPTPQRRAVVARELTKLHEESVRGSLAELAALDRAWIGEITLVLGPSAPAAAATLDEAAIDARIDAELARGRRAKDVAEQLALETNQPRRALYARVLARKR
ncbi:MAG TPA: ribosomal RNA small subunit methyltransferase I, partial [Byssovorax sp.]